MQRTVESSFKNIIGDTQETIAAIQRFIEKNSKKENSLNSDNEVNPSASINRIINSILNEEIANEIQKIIKTL